MGRVGYWLSLPRRWWHRHGFNVQSPWAYEFVRDAVADKSWFYAFDELAGTNGDRQLFRIVRWLAAVGVEAHTDSIVTQAHLLAPLGKLREGGSGITVFYYDAHHAANLRRDIDEGRFDSRSCVILDGVRSSTSTLWDELVHRLPTTSTFDLTNRGIAFFDPSRQKQHYLL